MAMPTIPEIRTLPDAWLFKALKAMRHVLQVGFFGAAGTMQKVVTFQDLVDLGITTENDIEDGRSMVRYFGSPHTDGSWKMEREGAAFVLARRVNGSWVGKGRWE